MASLSQSSGSPISSVPNEVLSKILKYALTSDLPPVHLQHFFDLSRKRPSLCNPEEEGNSDHEEAEEEEEEDDLADYAHNFTTSDDEDDYYALLPSKEWWFSELNPSQKLHFQDWLLINSTSRRFRGLGKAAFFLSKTFVITPSLHDSLISHKIKNLTPNDVILAIGSIQYVVATLRAVSAGSSFMELPRYQKALPRLCNLGIQPRIPSDQILWSLNSTTSKRHVPPKELMALLGKIGVAVDKIHVELIYDDSEDARQMHVACLHEHVYPYLRIMAERKAKRQLAGPSK